jgi:WD40 repeat protein
VWSVVAEPGGTLLTCGADGTVRRWNPSDRLETAALRERPLDGSEILRLEEGPSTSSASTASDGLMRPLVAIDRDGRIGIVAAPAGSIRGLPRPERAVPIEMALDAPRRRLAVSWLRDNHLSLFKLDEHDGSSPEPQSITLPVEIDPREAILCWTHAGELLVCSRAGRICLLSSNHDRARMIQSPLEDPVHELVIAPSGPPRVAASGKQTAIMSLPRGGASASTAPLLLPVGEESAAVAWSPDGALFACGTRTGKTLLFDAATGDPRGSLVPHERGIVSATFSSDGRSLVTADNDCVRISDVATRSTLDEIRPGWLVRVVRLAADDSRLVVGGCMVMENGTDSARLAVMEFPPP